MRDNCRVNTARCISSKSFLKTQAHQRPPCARAPELTTPAPWLRTALMKDMIAVLRLTSSRYLPVLLSRSLISVCQIYSVSQQPWGCMIYSWWSQSPHSSSLVTLSEPTAAAWCSTAHTEPVSANICPSRCTAALLSFLTTL